MSQRQEFLELYLERDRPVRELCTRFGVSEKTGYKWIARFRSEGPGGLADRSRAPHHSPNRMEPAIAAAIIALRRRHPTYGARKLREILHRREPGVAWPAPSTVFDLLRTRGMVRRRRPHRSHGVPWDAAAHGLTAPTVANDVWAADFKGEFRLGTGHYCYPLTVSDLYSRFLISCVGLRSPGTERTQASFVRAFEEYGLPRVLRTDNGVPFAQPVALGRLSRLAVWWIRLGIRPERITPRHPQENGQHERLHRTLKADCTRPAAPTLQQQQRRFDDFRADYNAIRPHESLAMHTPASRYTVSLRPFPKRLPPLDYPLVQDVRRVGSNGCITFSGAAIFLASVLAGELVGLEEAHEDEWTIHLGPLTLGIYDARTESFNPGVYWTEKARITTTP